MEHRAARYRRRCRGQWTGEAIATFGLILTILGTVRFRSEWVAPSVALYIAAAYWFTFSTSFANPASPLPEACSSTTRFRHYIDRAMSVEPDLAEV